MDVGEVEQKGVEWMHVAQDREQWWVLLNTVMNVRRPWNTGNSL